jgi:hypothetical protein
MLKAVENAKPVYSQGKFDPAHPIVTQSFASQFEACAYAAFKRNIEGIIVPPSGAILRGRSADAAVTAGANSVIQTGKDLKLSDKKEIAAAAFDKEAPDTDFQDEDPGLLKDRTVTLVGMHHVHVAPHLKPIATQEAIRIEGESFDFAGTIDLVEEIDGEVVLSDLKTANRRGKHSVPGAVQASLYSFLYEKKHGRRPSKFRYDVLVDTKVPQVETTEGEVTQHDTALLMYRTQAILQELNMSLKTGVWRLAEQGHWRCESSGKWCAYLHMGCPKGKKL